ncbi:UDP-N-acetylglucosamine 2-epimerase (non-hydrolysing) [Alteromonadaceae bacterium Bs31]|nr:UDP-N-acetylglucosamine 2-epimerase (non-hydrolysing) [Alteromonadaceae bacterium Bs31]
MKNITVFTGTRAEYGLLYWLMKDIDATNGLNLQLLVSGAHLSPEFGCTYKKIEEDGFDINEKVEIVLSSDTAVGVAKSVGLGVLGFADAISRLKSDVLVVLGDRFEALAVAQTAMLLRVPILHLHGGEVTEGAYDDSIRHAITKLSYFHGVSTEEHRKRVIQLGESPERVWNVGAMGLDYLKRGTFMTLSELSRSIGFELGLPFFLVTYHPVTLAKEDAVSTIMALLGALDEFVGYQVIITYPNADDGGRKIIPFIEDYVRKRKTKALAVPSLGMERYYSTLKYCRAVIGNSSSGIIEAPAFGTPTVNIGERQKGRVAADSVISCGVGQIDISMTISNVVARAEKGEFRNVYNPYGCGNASEKVIEMIKKIPGSMLKPFHDLPEAARPVTGVDL